MDAKFDLVIIGGGPGGYVAAIRAAQLGLRVAIVEKTPALGGTCLNVGCIPSKALLSSTEHFHFLKTDAAAHGIHAENVRFDLGQMMERKNKVGRTLAGGVDMLMKRNGIERFHGHGRVVGGGCVRVEGEQTIELQSPHTLLATGSTPVELQNLAFDGDRVVNSTDALAFHEVPRRLAVVGAGAIGLEMSCIWRRLGAEVTVVEFLPRIAPGFDHDVALGLQRALEKTGITFHLNTKVTGLERMEHDVRLHFSHADTHSHLDADKVLVAVGRRPFMDDLFAEGLGVTTDSRGRIVVDENFQTSVEGIYAIGDLIPGAMLAHKAEEEGTAFAEKIAGRAGHVNYQVIPGVIYTNPEAAMVGLTEEDAGARGLEIRTGKFLYAANGRALAGGDTTGFVKLIADAHTDRLLGAHILSPHASELIAEVVTLMEYHGSAEDLARIVHAHPTLSEATREAALAVDGRAIHALR